MTIESSAAPTSEPGDASHSAVEKLVSLPVSGKHCLPLAEEMSWITESSLFCWYNKTARCYERWWKWEEYSPLETEKALFDFCIQKKKRKRYWCLIFSMKALSTFFLWKSIFVRKDFLIFCSQCHSRTRSAVYADTSNPWHPKSKHDHPSHWRYVGMYTEYRHYVCPSIAGGAGEYTRRTCKAWAGIKLLTTALPVSHAIFHHHFQVIVKSDAIYVPNSFMFLQLFCSTAAKPNWSRHIAPFSNNLGCKKCLSQQERMGLGFRSVSLGSHIGPGF